MRMTSCSSYKLCCYMFKEILTGSQTGWAPKWNFLDKKEKGMLVVQFRLGMRKGWPSIFSPGSASLPFLGTAGAGSKERTNTCWSRKGNQGHAIAGYNTKNLPSRFLDDNNSPPFWSHLYKAGKTTIGQNLVPIRPPSLLLEEARRPAQDSSPCFSSLYNFPIVTK